MKFDRFISIVTVLFSLCGASLSAHSAPVGRALVYINPQDYKYEVKLWHFYYSYWFSQGEAVEPVALDTLKPLFAETAMCDGSNAADLVIWIKPGMFYNPHMTTFYGKIVAEVHTGSGQLLATYKANVQHNGFLDVLPEQQVKSTYRAAMQEIVRKMQADTALMTLAERGLPESETKMPCGMVNVLHPSK